MNKEKLIKSDKGTPQGGIVSPVLGNIYLHFVLDDWFEKVVIKETKGYAGMVRYADDSVACFEYKEEAEKYLRSVKKRLAKFGLEVSEEKTKILEFGRFAQRNRRIRGERKAETFDFLGFTHYCSTGVNGQYRTKRKTSKKKLVGHYRYYGITDNTRTIRNFYEITAKMLYKVLNRRSQKNRV